MKCFRYAVFTMNSAMNRSFHWYAYQSNSASTCWEKWKHVDGQNFEFQWKLKRLRNIYSKQEKNRRKEELGRFGCVGIASFIHKAAKLPKIGLRWSQAAATRLRTRNGASRTKQGKLINYLSFFALFRSKQSRMLGKKKSTGKSEGEMRRCCIRWNSFSSSFRRFSSFPSFIMQAHQPARRAAGGWQCAIKYLVPGHTGAYMRN